MKQKILKLIKRLSRFTIDDIAIMSEYDENALVPVIDNFEDDGIIKKISDKEYGYIAQNKEKSALTAIIENNSDKKIKKVNIDFKTINTKQLFKKENEQEIFNNTPDWAKAKIIKHMTPQYQFNLGGTTDPLLSRGILAPEVMSQIDNEINTLNAIKQQYSNVAQPQTTINSLWRDIDVEVSSLTAEQQAILAQDSVYNEISTELQCMIQQALIDSVRDKIAATPKGAELLSRQLSNIRNKKSQIIAQSNKDMDLFKKFQIAVQANPNLTYAEFIKTIS